MNSRNTNQIPIDFAVQPSRGRDDFIPSKSLQAAISIVDEWPNWPNHCVILAGPTGAGKSHLGQIWLQQVSARLISLKMDMNELVDLAKLGPLLVEDIDRHMLDETKLFHLLNSVKEAGSTLLITTRSWPASWSINLPDLKSRIKAATVVEIGEPDELLLTQVMFKLFADRQIEVDEKVVNYLVVRMERSLAVAQDIVARIDHIALAKKVPVTRSIAAQVIEQLENSSQIL